MSVVLSEWAATQRTLLALELQYENEQLADKLAQLTPQECQDLGLSLLMLDIVDSKTSMLGRTTLTIAGTNRSSWTKCAFKVGDEVVLYSMRQQNISERVQLVAVVSKATNDQIEIVVDEVPEEDEFAPPLRMDLRSNEYTHQKMVAAVSECEKAPNRLARVLIEKEPINYRLDVNSTLQLSNYYNDCLNESQKRAVVCALEAPFVSIIHGPPGTGKTATVTELILQAVDRGLKLLVCAPSNVATDNVLERVALASRLRRRGNQGGGALGDRGARLLRLGHPARVSPITMPHCLDALILNNEGTEIVNDIRKEMNDLQKSIVKAATGKKKDKGKIKEGRAEMKALRKEARKREEGVVKSIIQGSNVVFSTCVGAGSRLLTDIDFDLVVIDEAAQGLEAACWIPLLRGKKCVLAGDHLQLPPTVKCSQAENQGLSVTLFERVIRDAGRYGDVSKLLDTQYRMNALISDWASSQMYESKLHAHSSVATHTLRDILSNNADASHGASHADTVSAPGGEPNGEAPVPVLVLLDTADCEMEEQPSDTGSHRNIREAEVVARQVHLLVKAGVHPSQIGVITPYNAQLDVLKQLLLYPADADTQHQEVDDSASTSNTKKSKSRVAIDEARAKAEVAAESALPGLEIRTVDGFQGGEKECIILSLVRSNDRGEVGFLGDHRRINVAITRAKRHLCVVCDVGTCSHDPFIASLLRHMSLTGHHRCVLEYMAADEETMWVESVEEETGDGVNVDGISPREIHLNPRSHTLPARAKGSTEIEVFTEKVEMLFKQNDEVLCMHTQMLDSGQSLAGDSEGSRPSGRFGPLQSIPFDFQNRAKDTASVHVVSCQDAAVGADADGTARVLWMCMFPTGLNSFQRRVVHEVAEKRAYSHTSLGDSTRRQIVVLSGAVNEDIGELVGALHGQVCADQGADAVAGSQSAKQESPGALKATAAANDVAVLEVHEETAEADNSERVSSEDIVKVAEVVASSFSGLVGSDSEDSSAPADGLKAAENQGNKSKSKKKKSKKKGSGGGGGNTVGGPQQSSDLRYYVGVERAAKQADAKKKIEKLDGEDFDDDFAAMEAAIKANQELAQLHQYRVPATAMPNFDRQKNSERLHKKIEEARQARSKGKSGGSANGNAPGAAGGAAGGAAFASSTYGGVVGGGGGSASSSSGGTNKSKKVVKKPPPNFGGGRLGP